MKFATFLTLAIVSATVLPAGATLVDMNRENTVIWQDTGDQFDLPIANISTYVSVGDGTSPLWTQSVTGDVSLKVAGMAEGVRDNTFNRDRNSSTYGPKNTVIRDFVGSATGFSYAITITDLAAGTYDYSSWHFDPGDTRWSSRGASSHAVTLTDAAGTGVSVGTANIPGNTTLNINTDPFFQLTPVQFQIVSDGVNPIVINYGAGTSAFVINGFEITAIPEPATMSLVAAGALTLIRRRRRK